MRNPFRLALLAGANWRERSIASIGALLGIGLAALISTMVAGSPGTAALLAAPIGASAVLLFAVPTSPLAQPWPIIGGNIVSMLVGVAVAHVLGHGAFAAGMAVGLAILAMSALRCLHAPGGGTVLLPVLGGPAILAHGYAFALVPVGLNAALLVLVGLVFHRFSGHSYPHRAAQLTGRPRLLAEDIDAALAETGEAFDVSVEDLQALLERAERHAEARRK
ncbi:HPP family protein [Sphingomonas sp. JC676]|uniref:HPP family protein n=1 Tax=Sphingomonas sp. JC676 TaxID=2768065 RepID=UPI001657C29F|nr:HPP family protein [Sphingomonas sp. JC676]MBC9033551.1 HPP family protein [Sphingomonas sp. JC676]